ncbi:hypothetical protein CI610_01217 [invertebrate metagenome]|uniref:Membrane transporter protein n=1 Tax=invertebrate metagenome TaxID=1711999 RepID=A0A2H9T945_9ZZZZ
MEVLSIDMLWVMVTVTVGAFVQGAMGFGLAVVAAPILYMINPVLVPGVSIMSALFIGLLTVSRYFRSVQKSTLFFSMAGRIPGSVVGGLLLTWFSVRDLELFIGGSVLAAVLVSCCSFHIRPTRKSLFVAGVLSGVMGTAASVGGPPVAMVMQGQKGDAVRGTLSAFFVMGCLVSLGILAMTHRFGWNEMKISFCLLPGIILGSYLAAKATPYMQDNMRTFTLLLCAVSGGGAIVSALL